MTAELTWDDRGTLEHCAYLRRHFDAGIFPRTIGDRSHFAKLVRRGLLEFYGWGRDIDGEVERDVALYKLTALGEATIVDPNTMETVERGSCRGRRIR